MSGSIRVGDIWVLRDWDADVWGAGGWILSGLLESQGNGMQRAGLCEMMGKRTAGNWG